MDPVNRRTALRAVGLVLGLSLGGCLSEHSAGTPGGGGTPTDSPTPTPRTDGGLEYEVRQIGRSLGEPTWYGDDRATGHAELYATAEAARGGLDLDTVPEDRRENVSSFVDGTDFDGERLLYVASVGPDTCHGRVEVSDLSVDGDVLTGDARAVDTGDQGEACGDAITFPAALVRVRFADRPRNAVRLTVTDGWDETTAVETVARGVDPRTLDGHVQPAGDPETVPPELVCDRAEFTRHFTDFSGRPRWGESTSDWGAFSLRVDSLAAAPGDTVTVTLTNVGADEAYTGNRHKYNIQVLTEAGWQDVRGFTGRDALPYTDEALGHEPGRAFEWSFELTPEGVLEGHVHEEDMEVCPGLPAGRYRFVFWEPTVAVAFDVIE